jgi:[amino group carrier protein]-L-2-aminoadipate/L-glutamate 6-kinase
MIILKIGGGKDINLEGIVRDLAEIKEQFLIVHGANALRDELAAQLGIEKKIITSLSGYSSVYSDESAIELLMMAYAGLRNKRIVELCQRFRINAVGLCGIDGNIIQGKRNNGIRYHDKGKTRIIHDLSGKPAQLNMHLITLLLNNGYTPVLTVPIIDENGYAINSENDDIIALLQRELRAEHIVQLIEAPGFLRNTEDSNSLIAQLTHQELAQWEQHSEGRMKRKLHALAKLFEHGSTTVTICDGRTERPVAAALNNSGTVIRGGNNHG